MLYNSENMCNCLFEAGKLPSNIPNDAGYCVTNAAGQGAVDRNMETFRTDITCYPRKASSHDFISFGITFLLTHLSTLALFLFFQSGVPDVIQTQLLRG